MGGLGFDLGLNGGYVGEPVLLDRGTISGAKGYNPRFCHVW